MQAAAELSGAEAEAQALRERRDALAATEVTARTTGMPNVAADAMRAQLYTLQMKEQELLAVHPEQHPDVQAVRKQTEAARAILGGRTAPVNRSRSGRITSTRRRRSRCSNRSRWSPRCGRTSHRSRTS